MVLPLTVACNAVPPGPLAASPSDDAETFTEGIPIRESTSYAAAAAAPTPSHVTQQQEYVVKLADAANPRRGM